MWTISSRSFERLRRILGGARRCEGCQYLSLVHMEKVIDEDEAEEELVPMSMESLT